MKPRYKEIEIRKVGGIQYSVRLAKKLNDNAGAIQFEGQVYFSEAGGIQKLADDAAAFVSGVWTATITGKPFSFLPGFCIGERKLRIQLISERKLFPYGWDQQKLAEGIVIVARRSAPEVMISSMINIADQIWRDWEKNAIKRALRREKAVVDLSAAQDKPDRPGKARKPAGKPRVKPGELLPAAERDATLAEGDAVLRDMIADLEDDAREPA